MRPLRTFLVIVATYRSGRVSAIVAAIDLVNSFASLQLAVGSIGHTTWSPLPPEVFTKLVKPRSCSLSRTSIAAVITAFHGTSALGSRSKISRSGFSRLEMVDHQG